MKSRSILICTVMSVLAVPLILGGCDRKVSSTSKETVKSDGTTKSESTKVTESPDGTVTKEKSEKTTTPKSP